MQVWDNIHKDAKYGFENILLVYCSRWLAGMKKLWIWKYVSNVERSWTVAELLMVYIASVLQSEQEPSRGKVVSLV